MAALIVRNYPGKLPFKNRKVCKTDFMALLNRGLLGT